jgi:DNA-binding PadR family transcriptional regulator
MSTKLVVLGLLREAPKHGYEIKRRFEAEAMAEWTGVSFGAVYSALDSLATQGLVEKVGTEQVGRGPSREVYRITQAGREEFIRLLRQALSTISRDTDPVDIAFRFLDALPVGEARSLLGARRAQAEHGLSMLEEEKARFVEAHQKAPYLEMGNLMFDHWLLRLGAELAWVQSVLDRL